MKVRPSGSAVFVGCARSCADHLETTLRTLKALAATYEKYAVVIFENDSEDATPQILEQFAAENGNLTVLTRPGFAAEEAVRTKRLAFGRNACLAHIRSTELAGYDDLVVADLDAVNGPAIPLEGFMSARRGLHADETVHGVFANSQPIYYDIWTIRHPTWCPDDCWARARAEGYSQAARAEFVYSRMIPLAPSAEPIEVGSAFGGLAIYKMASALAGEYADPTPADQGQGEHVAFNLSITQALGGRFLIWPSLTNRTPWEHVLPEFNGELRHIELAQGERSGRIVVPKAHMLDKFRAEFPHYDRRLPALSRIVSDQAPGTAMIDIGANVGDTAALCRLAGCTLEIAAVEAALSHYKLLEYNLECDPALFGATRAHWAFAGRSEDRGQLFTVDGTASLIRPRGAQAATAQGIAPAAALGSLTSTPVSLIKVDTDGYDQVILENELPWLKKQLPILWVEAQSEAAEADETWSRLLGQMHKDWPWIMAFDNYGFCLLAGETSRHGQACVDLIASARRYRRAHKRGLNTAPRLYYLDIALFPRRYEAVFEQFRSSLPEMHV